MKIRRALTAALAGGPAVGASAQSSMSPSAMGKSDTSHKAMSVTMTRQPE